MDVVLEHRPWTRFAESFRYQTKHRTRRLEEGHQFPKEGLRKATGNYLVKRLPRNNMVSQNKKGPQSRAPLKWGEGAKNTTASRHQGCLINDTIKIGCWNVRTLNRVGKLENVKIEMKENGLSVLGLSEVRWRKENEEEEERGDFMSDDVRVIYSGGEECQRGVAVLLDKEWAKRVIGVEKRSDRLLMVKLKGEPRDIVIIQVYMPTSDHEDEEVEKMYEQIEELVDKQKGTDCVVVMGDWNAVVGEGRDGAEVGQFGLGTRNDRGERLVEFCRSKKMVVSNTWFEQEKRRRYTWKKPGDTGRYQIDYILVRQRYRNSVKSAKSYPGADIDSDHNLVAMKMRVELKKMHRGKQVRKWDLEKMKKEGWRFRETVEETLSRDRKQGGSVEKSWSDIRDSMTNAAKEVIGYKKATRAKKPWVTTAMLNKMNERRKCKSTNNEEGRKQYRQLNNELRRETDLAKEKWWEEECVELEKLESSGRDDILYRRVRQLTSETKNAARSKGVKDSSGILLTDSEDIMNRWREYIETLYDKDGKPREKDIDLEESKDVSEDCMGPEILESEVRAVIKEMKENKAVGVDGIPAEFLKNLGPKGLQVIVEMCKKMYEQGEWPEEFTKVVLIPIPKKSNATECGDYRTISLICHASKIMLKILTKRIEHKVQNFISKNQFGFKRGCGTRDAIGVLRMLCERNIEYGKDVYVCFVDFEKAFDRVNWTKMMRILEGLRIDWKDRKMIKELYMRQEAVVRIGGEESESGTIGRGVRQGCPLSPLLFSIYVESMMVEAMEDVEEGIKIGGQWVKDVRFADDQAMVSNTEEGLQLIMNKLNDTAKKYDMKINVKKTKTMIITKNKEEVQETEEGSVKWPCAVCKEGVGRGSIQCTKCKKWVHKKCSGLKGKLPLTNAGFVCKVCIGAGAGADVAGKSLVMEDRKLKSVNIVIDGKQVEQVDRFMYLGAVVTQDGGCTASIKERIGMAKGAFDKRRELLKKGFRKGLKKRLVKCLVWPVALYGCETWTLRKAERDKLEAFEMWIWRRMERVSWKDKKSNEQVLHDVGEERSMLETIVKRKKNWIGHVLRGDGMMKDMIEGGIEGKRAVGKPRQGMLYELMEGRSYEQMKRKAEDRELWRKWIPRTCLRAEN